MDLKHYKVKIILHIVDHCTRLSASANIPNKQPETIIPGYHSISMFTSMCEKLDISIKSKAAESHGVIFGC